MPELPEVQTVVSTLQPHLVGSTIAAVHLHRTDIVTPADLDLPPLLLGQTITQLHRRAKRIVFTLADGNQFYIHLGMSGQLTVESPAAEVKKHTHLVLKLRHEGTAARRHEAMELRFRDPRRFGGIFWLGKAAGDDPSLGPEPLTLRSAVLIKRLSNTRRPIKSALLDQTLIAGIGNIYADESLFRAKIHPLTPANTLDPKQIARLNRAIKQILNQAIKAKGSTLRDYVDSNNQPGEYRAKHKVYGQEGKKCPCCRATIVRIVLTGRSTCFCPKCQPPR